jgi:serine/threonine protein kinase
MLSGFLPFGDSDDEINKKKVLEGKIKMPKFFSEEAKNLLKHMLDINPLTRYTLDDIMEHPWFNKMKFNITPGIIVGINSIPIDKKILDLCVTYNLDKNKVKNSVANNKFNNESAVYYLLVQKLKKMGKDSISDLCSEKYIDYMINEGNEFLNCSIYNNDYKDKDDLNEQNKQNQIIIERKRNKVLTGFKNYYNSLNIDNDNKYIQLNSEEISESQTKKKKFIKIENNFKENTISLDERKETNETIKNGATHRIKLPKTILKKNLIENNEESDYFLKEVMNQNSLDTDRIITRGKLIKNNKLVLIGKEKDNKKKNKIYIK